ncbi:hypothetical protein [Paenibacillus lentus]|uniref:hypothetical protein n=1 Tax=Paenibacillus lentus TaxID=1338368 RepID=UPI0036D42627
MMNFKEDSEKYLTSCNTEQNLRELRKNVWKFLEGIDQQINSRYPKTGPHSLCPRCRSSNTKKNGKKQKRSRCLDCGRSYSNILNNPHIFYHKRHPEKLLNFIFLIYKTDKRIPEILNELGLSNITFYKWKKEILAIMPFLKKHFKNRR